MHKRIVAAVNGREPELVALANEVWRHAELGLVETESAAAVCRYLEANGFDVEMGVAGMDTAFVASVGQGGPVIGFLGEYDALPGVGNEPVPYQQPVVGNSSGHGCGHNLLGAASAGAAVVLKDMLQERGAEATIKYFGSPAEETSFGKMWMVAAGVFDGVDIALTWHPGGANAVTFTSSLADWVYKFNFHGKTAHAAANPYEGRSALDAVELMNDGIERMREHIRPECRIHYIITHGGMAPNVVPAYAQSFFDIRAATLPELDELYAWVEQVGQGAALMTQTRFEPEFVGAAANTIANRVILEILQQALEEVGPPAYTEDELAFAAELQESFPGCAAKARRDFAERAQFIKDDRLCDVVLPMDDAEKPGKGSTDVGDVSWVVPTGQFTTTCYALGVPGHNWAATACSGAPIGHKGMLYAAKVLAVAGLRFATDPALREAAWAELRRRLGEHTWKSPIPAGIDRPPLPYGKR